MTFDLLVALFPYKRALDPDVSFWLGDLQHQCKSNPLIRRYSTTSIDDTPITMTRNLSIKRAKEGNFDFLLMIDSDMGPDNYLSRPGAKPFFQSSFDFMIKHAGPSIVAAPYCGPPPDENVYIFHTPRMETRKDKLGWRLAMIPRESAAQRAGMEEVIALPTGLMLIDMRAIDMMKPPYFDYEWADAPFNTEKASTEDVYFTRNASFAGVKVYSNWDAWATHWKFKAVGPPDILRPENIRESLREALADSNRLPSNKSLIFLKESANGIRKYDTGSLVGVRDNTAEMERPVGLVGDGGRPGGQCAPDARDDKRDHG